MELKFFWQLTLRGQRFFLIYRKKCLKNAVPSIVILITINIERCHTYAYFGKIFSTSEANSALWLYLCNSARWTQASQPAQRRFLLMLEIIAILVQLVLIGILPIIHWYTDGTNSVRVVVISYDPLFNLYIDIFKNFFHS